MRIGIITTSYPREEDDPAGAFVAGFARWLAREVGSVEVLCAAGGRRLFYRGGAPAELGRGRGWLLAAGFSARLALAVQRRARAWDAVVSHWLLPSAGLAAWLAPGRPHLAIAHGSDVRLLLRLPGGRSFLARLGRRADLVYVAQALAQPAAPGRVVAMGIDVRALAGGQRDATRAALGLDGFCALYLGRLSREKGIDLLLDGLPPRVTLLIAGAGPERALLERRARGKPVRFLGEVRGPRKADLLAAADALVLPSRADGAPTVLCEAMAAGLPIVATRVGGIAELVADGENGLLCAPTAAALGDALQTLRSDRALASHMQESAHATAHAHDWSVVAPRLCGTLLGRGPGGSLRVTRV